MPQRSSVESLPGSVKAALDKRLLQGGFAGYEGLRDWLAEKGYRISKSAIHRYGQKFEEKLGAVKLATEQAKAIAEVAEDDGNAMGDALMRMVQEETFQYLVNLAELDPERINLHKIGTMVAKLSSASVQIKKHRQEVQAKAQVAAQQVEKTVERALAVDGKKGLSPELARELRAQVLGIAA